MSRVQCCFVCCVPFFLAFFLFFLGYQNPQYRVVLFSSGAFIVVTNFGVWLHLLCCFRCFVSKSTKEAARDKYLQATTHAKAEMGNIPKVVATEPSAGGKLCDANVARDGVDRVRSHESEGCGDTHPCGESRAMDPRAHEKTKRWELTWKACKSLVRFPRESPVTRREPVFCEAPQGDVELRPHVVP